MQEPELAARLLRLVANDEQTRARLAADGSLFDGYHPEMEAVHAANASALRAMVDAHGWPGRRLVGDSGAEAAWRIAQHAIGEPGFMRRALTLVQAAVAGDDAPAWQAAYLEDRVRSLEGRPQLYGTQYDWDVEGRMSPLPEIEEPAGVDARRAAVGLGPLSENTARMHARVAAGPEGPPVDLEERRRSMAAWARKVGWRAD